MALVCLSLSSRALAVDGSFAISGTITEAGLVNSSGFTLTDGNVSSAFDYYRSLNTISTNPLYQQQLTVFNGSGSAKTVRVQLFVVLGGSSRAFSSANYGLSASWISSYQTISDGANFVFTNGTYSGSANVYHMFNKVSPGTKAAYPGLGDGTLKLKWVVQVAGVAVGDPLEFVVNVTDDSTYGAPNTTGYASTPASNNIWPWGGEPEETALFNSTFTVTDYRPGLHTVTLSKGITPGELIYGTAGPPAANYQYQGSEFGTRISITQYETWTEGDIGQTWYWNLDGVSQGLFIVAANEGTIGPEGMEYAPDMYTVDAGAKFPGDSDEEDPDYVAPETDPEDPDGFSLDDWYGPAELDPPTPDPDVFDPETDPNPLTGAMTKADVVDAIRAGLSADGTGLDPSRIPGTTPGEYIEGIGDDENPFLEGADGLQTKLGEGTQGLSDELDGITTGLAAIPLPSGIPTGDLGSVLEFDVSLPLLGDHTLSLVPYSAQISIVRNLLLLVAAVVFWFLLVKTVRGHSA